MEEIPTLLSLSLVDRHPEDAARLLDAAQPETAAAVLDAVAPEAAAPVLAAMAPANAAECLAHMTDDHAASAVSRLATQAGALLLRRMEPGRRARILERVRGAAAANLKLVLHNREGTAGAVMDPGVLALPRDLSVAEAGEKARRSGQRTLYYLYVVGRDQRLVGVLTLRELLLARPDADLGSIMHTTVARVPVDADFAAIVRHPSWRDVHALPVVDRDGRLVGVIRYETLRNLEEEMTGRGRREETTSIALSVGELYLTGVASLLKGLVSGPTGGR